jgi:hypothetical protein
MGQMGASATTVVPQSFPASGPIAKLQDWNSPRFIVTVDTEEEFDWSGPFTRDQHGLSHLRAIDHSRNYAKKTALNLSIWWIIQSPQMTLAPNCSKAWLMPAWPMLGCNSIHG